MGLGKEIDKAEELRAKKEEAGWVKRGFKKPNTAKGLPVGKGAKPKPTGGKRGG